MTLHSKYMLRAIALAEKARGMTSPNPLVGAVVVKNKKIIAEGYHRKAGRRHAEIVALDKAGNRARGATLYVTLEPCTHYGKTPPCCERIIAEGIATVVVGTRDPNPVTKGKAFRLLRKTGITVITGVEADSCRRLNEPFNKVMCAGRPLVTVKAALSLDGKIATRTGQSQWISSPASRRVVQRLRGEVDAIAVGVETILTDDPRLSCRASSGAAKKQPIKVILDSRLRTPLAARIFSDDSPGRVIMVTTAKAPAKKKAAFIKKGIDVITLRSCHSRVSIPALVKALLVYDIHHIVVEGGGAVVGSFFDAQMVDKVKFFIAPIIIGGQKATSVVEGKGIACLSEAVSFEGASLTPIGQDYLFEGDVIYTD